MAVFKPKVNVSSNSLAWAIQKFNNKLSRDIKLKSYIYNSFCLEIFINVKKEI
jgi:hypothetical protein